jgi:hypothetical protein
MKFFELRDVKVKRDTENITQMLNSEKSCIILLNTIFGTYIFPTKIYNKTIEFELYLKNEDKTKFFKDDKKEKDLIFYFF